jgi:hypothetical protein
MKKTTWMISLFLCVILVAAGCTDNSPPSTTTISQGSEQSQGSEPQSQQASASSSPAVQIKPKQLISKDDALKLLGESVKEGVEDEKAEMGLSGCYYAAETMGSKTYLQISVLQKPQEGGQQSAQPSGGGESGGQQSGGESSGSPSGGQSGGGESGQEKMTPKIAFETVKKVFADPNAAVTGFVGDDKFLASPGICFLSGDYCVYVAVGNADPAKALAIVKQAAELAFINLKRVQGK